MIATSACKHCGDPIYGRRSDTTRCENCRKQYLQEYRRRLEVKLRRAEQHRKIRWDAFLLLGGKCECCSEGTFEFLAIDHINGNGRQDRETRSTWQIARQILTMDKPEAEYRVLCHNCNQAKGWYGFCPHQWKRTA